MWPGMIYRYPYKRSHAWLSMITPKEENEGRQKEVNEIGSRHVASIETRAISRAFRGHADEHSS